MTDSLQVDIRGTSWTLLAERAVFWNERRWLIVADVHFGKAATFRTLGVPVPHGTTSENLARLSRLIDDDSVRLPCFWLRDGLMVLPAFGSFTGGAYIDREEGDRVVAVAEDRVFELRAPPYKDLAARAVGQNA